MKIKYEIINAPSGDWQRTHLSMIPSPFVMKNDLEKYLPVFHGFLDKNWIEEVLPCLTLVEDYINLVKESLDVVAKAYPNLIPAKITETGLFKETQIYTNKNGKSIVCICLKGNTKISFFDGTSNFDLSAGDMMFIPGGPLFQANLNTLQSELLFAYIEHLEPNRNYIP